MRAGIRRPSAALIVAIVALIAALAGGAYAASKIQTADIAKQAVTTPKIAGKAVTTPKLGGQSVVTSKLAKEGVTTKKLSQGERSEGYVTNQTGTVPVPAATSTTVATLDLPTGGQYLVTAGATLGNDAATANLAHCELRDDGTKITAGNDALPPAAVFAATITLTGASDGGTVTLACDLDNAGQARDRVITATRVGSLTQ